MTSSSMRPVAHAFMQAFKSGVTNFSMHALIFGSSSAHPDFSLHSFFLSFKPAALTHAILQALSFPHFFLHPINTGITNGFMHALTFFLKSSGMDSLAHSFLLPSKPAFRKHFFLHFLESSPPEILRSSSSLSVTSSSKSSSSSSMESSPKSSSLSSMESSP